MSNNNRPGKAGYRITIDGQTRTAIQWCQILGLPYGTYRSRRRRGLGVMEALIAPLERQPLTRQEVSGLDAAYQRTASIRGAARAVGVPHWTARYWLRKIGATNHAD